MLSLLDPQMRTLSLAAWKERERKREKGIKHIVEL